MPCISATRIRGFEEGYKSEIRIWEIQIQDIPIASLGYRLGSAHRSDSLYTTAVYISCPARFVLITSKLHERWPFSAAVKC